jgi:hypothetical protein
VLSNIDKIIPPPSIAHFAALSISVSYIASMANSQKAFADVNRQIVNYVNMMVTAPTCVFLARTYLKVVAVRAEKIVSPSERETFIIATANAWWEPGLENRDAYGISEVILEWLWTFLRYTKFEQLVHFLVNTLLKPGNRFFPVFVATIKFMKSLKGPNRDAQLDRIYSELRDIGKAMDKAGSVSHGWSLLLLATGGTLRYSLDLARLDCESDSEEAQAVFTKLGMKPPAAVQNPVVQCEEVKECKKDEVTEVGNQSGSADMFEPIPRSDSIDSNEQFELLDGPDDMFEPFSLGRSAPDAYDLFEPITPPRFRSVLPAEVEPILDLSMPIENVPAGGMSPGFFDLTVTAPPGERPPSPSAPLAQEPDDDLIKF